MQFRCYLRRHAVACPYHRYRTSRAAAIGFSRINFGEASWPPAVHLITPSQIPKSPATPGDVAAFAAELLGIEPLPLAPWEDAEKTMTPMSRSFYMETKRVRNGRIKDELVMELRYPSFREGLKYTVDNFKALAFDLTSREILSDECLRKYEL